MKQLRNLILVKHFQGKPVSPNSCIMRNYKALLPATLSVFLQAMLVGLMLGDVSLKTNKNLTGASIQFE